MKQKLYYTLNASRAYQVTWVPSWCSSSVEEDETGDKANAAAPEKHASASQEQAYMCKHAYCVENKAENHDEPLQACEP